MLVPDAASRGTGPAHVGCCASMTQASWSSTVTMTTTLSGGSHPTRTDEAILRTGSRARRVPVRTACSGQPRLLTDKPERMRPGHKQVRRVQPPPLQAGGQGFESP